MWIWTHNVHNFPLRSRKKKAPSRQALSMLACSVSDTWSCRLTITNERGQHSEALCFSTTLVSIHKNVAILSCFMFMHDRALAKIFFAWWEKLVVQGSVNRLLAVLCGRTGGSHWTQKACRAKWNVLCQSTWFTFEPLSLVIHSAWIYYS